MADDRSDESIDQGPAWGWGWLSGAAQAAKVAFDSNVKPALISMENSTSQFVQEVTKVIDLQLEVPEEPEDSVPEEEEREKVPSSSYPADQVPSATDTTEEPVDDSIFSDAIGGIAYISGVVKQLGSQLGDVDQMEASIRRGGQKLQTAINEAYTFITEDEEVQRRPESSSSPVSKPQEVPRTPLKEATSSNISASSTPTTPASRATMASPTFASLFEAKMGAVDMAALENMSTQASIQLQQIVRKLTDQHRPALMTQQEALRAIYAVDVLEKGTEPLDLSKIQLPSSTPTDATENGTNGDKISGDEEKNAREKLETAFAALHQKISFYASRTASLQGFAMKAISESLIPENGDIQALSEGTLNYRGKMQLEALRQVAEFTALSVHQILLLAEHLIEYHKIHPSMDLETYAQTIHQVALTCKFYVASISQQLIVAMKALGNAFKEKATTASAHPNTQATGQATLKRISAGMNNVHLDLATAMASILDASRFTLALAQHLGASQLIGSVKMDE